MPQKIWLALLLATFGSVLTIHGCGKNDGNAPTSDVFVDGANQ